MLSQFQKDKLDEDITKTEVIKAIQSLPSNKAPGKDGFTTNFYKTFDDLLADKLLEVYIEAKHYNTLPPKYEDPFQCGSYRPIQLLNVDQKILGKIIAARLK